jgi:MFS family permease
MIKSLFAHRSSSPKQIRIAVAALFFVSGFGFSSFASRIPSIQQNLHINEAQLGTALFAIPFGLVCMLPLTGYILGKYESRYGLIMGASFYNICLCLLGYVTNVWQLMAVLFFFGGSRNLMNIAVNAQSIGVQKLYAKSIITTFHGIWSITGFVGGALGGLMISHDISLPVHFEIAAVICFVLIGIFFKDTVRNDVRQPEEGAKRVWYHFPKGALLILGIIAFCCMTCEGIMFDWSGIYFQKVVHVSKQNITTGYVAFMCAAAVARFSGDWLINKLGTKKVLQLCSGFAFVGFLISIAFPYLIPATIGFVLVGIGVSCIVPIIMALAGKTSGKSAGIAIASVSTVSYFGFLFGPPVIGYIAQAANLQWSFSLGLIISACMLVLVSLKIEA